MFTIWRANIKQIWHQIPTFRHLHNSIMAECEVLFPRQAGKFIAENSKDVTINDEGIQNTARKVMERLKLNPEELDVDRWQLHSLNPSTKDQQAVDWVFLSDVLNFSFWSDDESNKYKVKYKGESWTGYWSLCAAINRAIDEGIPITDPKFYQNVSLDRLKHIMRSDSEVNMPLIEQRLQVLHEAGHVLVEKYDGSFVNVIKAADQSAQKLLWLVVQDFPSFRDVAQFAGKKVAIYKRVQILIGDIWASCGGQGFGSFHDIDSLTMFADYRIPQALVWFGALKYSDELMDKLNKSIRFDSGDREEVEIRGCSIWAVELIVDALKSLLAKDSTHGSDVHVNAVILDHYLWDFRREHSEETQHIPIHKTRCIYY